MEERSAEEMVVIEREEREEEEAQRDDSERVEDEGDSTERQEREDSDFGGAKRARSGALAYSSEQELDIIEFVKDHAELYDKEHVHYVDKARKDALWDEIGRRVETSNQDARRWFQS